MTTDGLPDTFTYTTTESVSRLVAPSTCAYGSEGWGFESLRARLKNIGSPALRRISLCAAITSKAPIMSAANSSASAAGNGTERRSRLFGVRAKQVKPTTNWRPERYCAL